MERRELRCGGHGADDDLGPVHVRRGGQELVGRPGQVATPDA
jgi:hypothetical protein